MIRGIWRKAHSHRQGHDGLSIAMSRGIDARSFVSQGVRAMYALSVGVFLLPSGVVSRIVQSRGSIYRKVNAAIVHDYRSRRD